MLFKTKFFNPAAGYHEPGKWVWCGCCVEEKGIGFHLYSSRWRKDYPMLEGYVLFSEIVHAFSDSMLGPYHFVERVLPTELDPSRWDGMMAHNPTVVMYKDEYLLYYIASTYGEQPTPVSVIKQQRDQVGRVYSRIRIGMMRSKSPAGPWMAMERPILDVHPGYWDHELVTNPAPCVTPDGKIYLYYRSNAPEGTRLGLAVAASPEGPYVRVSNEPIMPNLHVEDPFTWHDGKMFRMLAKDQSGKHTGEYHAGVLLHSINGIDWIIDGKGYSRTMQTIDGKEITLGSLERPQLLFGDKGLPKCLFAATADGPGGFKNADNTWNTAIELESI